MVNKTELSAYYLALGEGLLLKALLENQTFQALTAGGLFDAALSLPAKLAKEYLFKEQLGPNGSNGKGLSRLVTQLPSLKNLSSEVLKLFQTSGGKERIAQQGEKNAITPDSTPSKTLTPGPERKSAPPVFLTSPTILTTVKEVLSMLSYLAGRLETFTPDQLSAFQKIVQPLIDQLVQPVKKQEAGEFETWKENTSEVTVEKPKERNLPLPKELPRTNSDRPLTQERIGRPKTNSAHERVEPHPKNQSHEQAFASPQEKASSTQTQIRSEKESAPMMKPENLTVPKERVQMPLPSVPDRTAIPAAPFSPQIPINTAPRREKKRKDPWEREEEDLTDEDQNPFDKP